jgi:hypothetical protein
LSLLLLLALAGVGLLTRLVDLSRMEVKYDYNNHLLIVPGSTSLQLNERRQVEGWYAIPMPFIYL